MFAVFYDRKDYLLTQTFISSVNLQLPLKHEKDTQLHTCKVKQRAHVVLQLRHYGGEARQSGAVSASWFKCENSRIVKVKM